MGLRFGRAPRGGTDWLVTMSGLDKLKLKLPISLAGAKAANDAKVSIESCSSSRASCSFSGLVFRTTSHVSEAIPQFDLGFGGRRPRSIALIRRKFGTSGGMDVMATCFFFAAHGEPWLSVEPAPDDGSLTYDNHAEECAVEDIDSPGCACPRPRSARLRPCGVQAFFPGGLGAVTYQDRWRSCFWRLLCGATCPCEGTRSVSEVRDAQVQAPGRPCSPSAERLGLDWGLWSGGY